MISCSFFEVCDPAASAISGSPTSPTQTRAFLTPPRAHMYCSQLHREYVRSCPIPACSMNLSLVLLVHLAVPVFPLTAPVPAVPRLRHSSVRIGRPFSGVQPSYTRTNVGRRSHSNHSATEDISYTEAYRLLEDRLLREGLAGCGRRGSARPVTWLLERMKLS